MIFSFLTSPSSPSSHFSLALSLPTTPTTTTTSPPHPPEQPQCARRRDALNPPGHADTAGPNQLQRRLLLGAQAKDGVVVEVGRQFEVLVTLEGGGGEVLLDNVGGVAGLDGDAGQGFGVEGREAKYTSVSMFSPLAVWVKLQPLALAVPCAGLASRWVVSRLARHHASIVLPLTSPV